jgi:hypothetical protein
MKRLMGMTAIITAISTVVLSMTLNVWAFQESLPGPFGLCIGILVPLWILALTLAGKWGSETPGKKYLGMASYGLAIFLLIVSLPHLAHGFDRITQGRWWESWSLAIVADLTQVVMKLIVIALCKSEEKKAEVKKKEPKTRKKKKTVEPHLAEVG